MSFHVPEKCRITKGPFGSNSNIGNNGVFWMPLRGKNKAPLRVVSSDGMGWNHVSVSLQDRCPTWEEMCLVKDLFWDEDDCVMQLHPPRSEYVNNHRHCLHLWQPHNDVIPMPPSYMVGLKELGVLA